MTLGFTGGLGAATMPSRGGCHVHRQLRGRRIPWLLFSCWEITNELMSYAEKWCLGPIPPTPAFRTWYFKKPLLFPLELLVIESHSSDTPTPTNSWVSTSQEHMEQTGAGGQALFRSGKNNSLGLSAPSGTSKSPRNSCKSKRRAKTSYLISTHLKRSWIEI